MVTSALRIGVLALQGDVREHAAILTSLGAETVAVRRPEQMLGLDGLVLPGGESSVIDKLSRIFDLRRPILDAIADGMPMYGTCAGLILLADDIEGAIDGQLTFGGLDVTVARNAFGGQVESFETELAVAGIDGAVAATFIRAPLITRVGPRARAIASLPDGGVVAVEQGNLLGTSFHPEMNGETRLHERLLDLAHARRVARAA
ncbi:pyridoxal 5'-phosphate synthase glutaminase subunit PdxT [Microbacterium capsulatum]|uniref:Pyridoxal 5'-phosphate synthase subunit PdxT n=1 Tax=Microbacterium capsulatum TaxID=3041921 RepID=A0ABU0XCA6_9MICO|nr:pyridoxal 5'-phosphate synthase glutaminase subunit PdxT [Microbacterium sp. ASV81]MDQ4212746.1 pyridoxal 5'-phosphate synthase glutaminase subunit PdxT [Microbacterium sp. ASV81]